MAARLAQAAVASGFAFGVSVNEPEVFGLSVSFPGFASFSGAETGEAPSGPAGEACG